MKWKRNHKIWFFFIHSFIHSVAGLVVHRRFRITSHRKELANGILFLLLLLLLFLCRCELTMIVHGVKHTARNHVSHWKFIKSTSHFQQSLQANIYTIKHILLACFRFCFFFFFFMPFNGAHKLDGLNNVYGNKSLWQLSVKFSRVYRSQQKIMLQTDWPIDFSTDEALLIYLI